MAATRRDRLSALPEDTLIGVLSHLPTDEAVRTSVLSRRWRHLHAAVPVIDIVDPKVENENHYTANPDKPLCLEHRVTCALLSREPDAPIRAFRLDAFNPTYTLLDQWILIALASGAEELDVKLRCQEYSPLRLCPFGPYAASSANFHESDRGRYVDTHPHIFRSAALRRLSLSRWLLDLPRDVSAMALETLVLHRIMGPGDALQPLISRCPRLVHLTLEECPGVRALRVASACLESFSIVCCHNARRVVLESRRLRSLRYKGGLFPRDRSLLSVANHAGVTALTIDICVDINAKTPQQVAAITELIGTCTNLTFLHLALRPAMAHRNSLFASILRLLPRLRHLELKGCLRSEHSVGSVADLLESTPNVETLSLFPLLPDPPKKSMFFVNDLDNELREDGEDDKDVDYGGQVQVPEELCTAQSCFERRLRRISLVGYRGRPFERVLAKFLLSKAAALEKLAVSIAPGRSAYGAVITRELTSWLVNDRSTRVTSVYSRN